LAANVYARRRLSDVMKPYQQIAIVECHEPLVPIPLASFAWESPHPYQKVGAPYGDKSPFYLRQGILDRLLSAQATLQLHHPGWQIQIFDAYRPVAVQQYMVDYTFAQLLQAQALRVEDLSELQQQALWEQVYEFWAVPNPDPKLPPPHSTGAAIDVTLVDATGTVVDMGSMIDEISPRSYPDYFADCIEPGAAMYQAHRQILQDCMNAAEFKRHPREWWHFSYGDQVWAWLMAEADPGQVFTARYGGV
jgi:zinc D-Ala-D-Ala dipeptidase